MIQPLGFVDPNHPTFVCHLNKALYKLKQAPQAWFHQLGQKLQDLHFIPFEVDTSLYIHSTSTHTTIVLFM